MLVINVPPLMKNILKDINRAVLKEQSSKTDADMDRDDILKFIAQYLNTMARLRDTTGENPLEVTDHIEAFDNEEEPDLHITVSDVTDDLKPPSVASLISQKSAPKVQSPKSEPDHHIDKNSDIIGDTTPSDGGGVNNRQSETNKIIDKFDTTREAIQSDPQITVVESNPPDTESNVIESDPTATESEVVESDPPVTESKVVESDPPISESDVIESDPPISESDVIESDPPISESNVIESDPPISESDVIESDPPITESVDVNKSDLPMAESDVIESDPPITESVDVNESDLPMATS